MSSLPSEALSTSKTLQEMITHRIVDLNPSQYRRQVSLTSTRLHSHGLMASAKIEHFEYYWGLQRCTLDFSSPMNHVQRELSINVDLDKTNGIQFARTW